MPLPIRRHGARRAALALLVVTGLTAATTTSTTTSAAGATGSDEFRAGQVYRGDFPDPSVLRVGGTYYAYSTNTGGKLLPAMTSTDLLTWRTRASSTGRWWQNDALTAAPRWAARHRAHGGALRVSTWAPSVAAVGSGYVAAYAAPVSVTPRKMCVTLAHSTSPLGPFADSSAGPLVCPPDQGAIDPDVFVDAGGTPYLLWKTEGIPHRAPTRVWSQQLDATATGFEPGSQPSLLLTTEVAWEGNIIENPSLVRYKSWYYLLYSANEYAGASYAVGYALCRTPAGPCKRPAGTPLLATGGRVSGPGGPDAFYDAQGRLRMAYAAWDRDRVGYPGSTSCRSTARGCNQRRLHVATLAVGTDLTLSVTDRG